MSEVEIIRTKCCHLPLLTASHDICVVYFDSSWARKTSLTHSTELLRVLQDNKVSRIYHIANEFCDDMEGFVVSKGGKTLPCVAVYSSGKLVHFSDSDNLSAVEAAIQKPPTTKEKSLPNIASLVRNSSSSNPVRLFISGDRSSVGKSTCCLFLLAALVEAGVKPEDLAYIKPITQCEAEQPVVKFCTQKGIANRGIGPVVFYKGFTRAFLDGDTDSSEQLLASAVQSVEEIERGKKLVLIDGVGYPAVGSICGISNADAAKALNASVVLIGKSGVGDAVDSYNLNARFFEFAGVRVLGGIFNKIATEGFYNVEACRSAVSSYFRQYRPQSCAYGFVPVMAMTGDIDVKEDTTEVVSPALLEVFMNHVDIRGIINDALSAKFDEDCLELSKVRVREKFKPDAYKSSVVDGLNQTKYVPVEQRVQVVDNQSTVAPYHKRPASSAPVKHEVTKRSRAEIESQARSLGAVGG